MAGEPENAGTAANGAGQPMRKRHIAAVVGVVLLIVAAITGIPYYLHARHYQSTDDAFIDADVVAMAPQVAGRVQRVVVDDNQAVKAGDVLVEIDPADFQAKVAQAEATLKAAQSNLDLIQVTSAASVREATAGVKSAQAKVETSQAQVQAARALVAQAQAEVSAVEAEVFRAGTELQRIRELIKTQNASQQEVNTATAAMQSAQAKLEAAKKGVSATEAQVTQNEAQLTQSRSQLIEAEARLESAQSAPQQRAVAQAQAAQAQASLEQAKLNLQYTTLKAPVNGHVTRKSIEAGAYAQVGQSLMAIVPTHIYVTANFKETQLTHMRPGQPVTISVDAYPGLEMKGHVDSIQRGSGAAFSLLPPENATGNYVKVVQRVPVKIVIDEQPDAKHPLGPGMSVVPEVKVR